MGAQAKQLDQFYTQDTVALNCLTSAYNVIKQFYNDVDNLFFLEPSAGNGAFLRALQQQGLAHFLGCDIDPQHKKILRKDFLADSLAALLPHKSKTITIGNPPFGKRARLAAAFINQAFEYSETVAFILPLQFQKYSAQTKIIPKARLIHNAILDPNSFVFEGEHYSVRCCFQIWTTRQFGKDLRLRSAPIIKHPDFDMWQYNNTREAEKYFNKKLYQWDFAVPRQGYKDYTIKETDPDRLDRHTQWVFFKAHTPEALKNLQQLDFGKLSHKNTSTPGFGKADVVEEYMLRFSSQEKTPIINRPQPQKLQQLSFSEAF